MEKSGVKCILKAAEVSEPQTLSDYPGYQDPYYIVILSQL